VNGDLSVDELRAYYHETLPGGLARDWVNNAVKALDYQSRSWADRLMNLRRAAGMALLDDWDEGLGLHVDEAGQRVTYRECVLCRSPR